jgi:adenylylsulfate kinase-like enzyme
MGNDRPGHSVLPGSALPVLWLCGPPGVGKTAVAWEVYRRLVDAGTGAAYVDLDQLGICHPERRDDPDRHLLKARNVAALRENFAAAGASCLIVSGVVDPLQGPRRDIVGQPLTVVRMHVDEAELTARLATRPGSAAPAEGAGAASRLLAESTFADWCLDTSGRSVTDVADEVTARIAAEPFTTRRPGEKPTRPREHPVPAEAGTVLWLSGPVGVGKSTIGFQAYLRLVRTGLAAAYIDVDQLAFFAGDDPNLRAANLAAVWANHQAAGAQALVVVGPVNAAEMSVYRDALSAASLSWCRLAVSRTELTERVLSRRTGGSWAQPGDPLKGKSRTYLMGVAAKAADTADQLDALASGLRVDVDGLPPDAAATLILDRTFWSARSWA